MTCCPSCDSSRTRRLGSTRQGYPIHRCLACGRRFIGHDDTLREAPAQTAAVALSAQAIKPIGSKRHWKRLEANQQRLKSSQERKERQKSFLTMMAVVFLIAAIPGLDRPFEWLSTFFHEVSHAIAATVSGGHVIQISIGLLGGGYARIQDGSYFLIGWSGYAGAVIWGMGLYMTTLGDNLRRTLIWTGSLMGILALVTVLWVRDGQTLSIMTIIYLVWMTALIRARHNPTTRMIRFVRFAGLYVLMDAIISPFHLIGHSGHISDAYYLKQYTGLPEGFWIISWVALGVYALLVLFALHTGEIKTRTRKKRGAKSARSNLPSSWLDHYDKSPDTAVE